MKVVSYVTRGWSNLPGHRSAYQGEKVFVVRIQGNSSELFEQPGGSWSPALAKAEDSARLHGWDAQGDTEHSLHQVIDGPGDIWQRTYVFCERAR